MKRILLICCLAFGFSQMRMHAQYYDPNLDMMMYNQMLQNMFENGVKSLVEIQEKQQQQKDANASATITYMYDGADFYAFVTYIAGSPLKMKLVYSSGKQVTLIQNEDYVFANGGTMVIRKLLPGSTLKIYCSGTGKLLSSKSIPNRNASGYEYFCQESLNNCNKVAMIIYGTMNSSITNGSANSSSSGAYRSGKKRCSLCGGRGWYPGCSSPTYELGEVYCSECQRTVPSSHSHDTCPSCGGTGFH